MGIIKIARESAKMYPNPFARKRRGRKYVPNPVALYYRQKRAKMQCVSSSSEDSELAFGIEWSEGAGPDFNETDQQSKKLTGNEVLTKNDALPKNEVQLDQKNQAAGTSAGPQLQSTESLVRLNYNEFHSSNLN